MAEEVVGVRLEIRELAHAMEVKMRKNDHKGGWEDMDVGELIERLLQEVGELTKALIAEGSDHVRDECVDVANFAMMIHAQHQDFHYGEGGNQNAHTS